MNSSEHSILIVSPNQSMQFLVRNRFAKFGYEIRSISGLSELLTIEQDYHPTICIIEGIKANESVLIDEVSLIRKQMEGTEVFVTYKDAEIDAVELFQLGVKGIYQFPFEEERLINDVFQTCPIEIDKNHLSPEAMAKVNILELKNVDKLPFDVYIFFPMNKKFLLYRKKDSPMTEDVLRRFENQDKDIFYIRKTDLKAFQSYTASVLAKIKNDDSLDRVQKTRKLKVEMSNLLSGFFTQNAFDQSESKAFVDTTRKIVTEFIGQTSDKKALYQRIMSLASQSFSNYNHSVNTATYAAIFAILAQMENVEDISLAGLLHDIGLSEVSKDISDKDIIDMTPSEFSAYKMHPLYSSDLIRKKGIPVSDLSLTIIEQHHELPDGSGYPKGLVANQIVDAAKVLQMADHFDDLTSMTLGKKLLSPHEALKMMAGLGDFEEPAPYFDPSFHWPIIRSLLSETDVKKLTDQDLQDIQQEVMPGYDPAGNVWNQDEATLLQAREARNESSGVGIKEQGYDRELESNSSRNEGDVYLSSEELLKSDVVEKASYDIKGEVVEIAVTKDSASSKVYLEEKELNKGKVSVDKFQDDDEDDDTSVELLDEFSGQESSEVYVEAEKEKTTGSIKKKKKKKAAEPSRTGLFSGVNSGSVAVKPAFGEDEVKPKKEKFGKKKFKKKKKKLEAVTDKSDEEIITNKAIFKPSETKQDINEEDQQEEAVELKKAAGAEGFSKKFKSGKFNKKASKKFSLDDE